MKAEYWHGKWQSRDIAFHQGKVNRLLASELHTITERPPAHLFLPLCGKSRDIAWLLAQGYEVSGIELNESAVIELFEELDVIPEITKLPSLTKYESLNLTVFVGDIFVLTPELIGTVDAIYDRAAFIALPQSMLESYSQQLRNLTNTAPQLVVGYDYNQSLLAGPPFAINVEILNHYYGEHYEITELARLSSEPIKGIAPGEEVAWLLK